MSRVSRRRRRVVLGASGVAALALAPRVRLARAGAVESATGRAIVRWTRERFPLPGSASDANPAIPVTSKHCRWVLCPDDGKFYIFGGDYPSRWQPLQSGQNALLTYDPRTRAWEQAYPFWGKAGQHYPVHMDEVAVCWDSKRRLFWFTSGYQGGITGDEATRYTGIPTSGIVQAFDPRKRDWLTPFGPDKAQVHVALGGGQHNRSVYDVARDLILAGYYDGSFGTGLMEFDPSTGEYKRNRVQGLGNWHPTAGETIHLVDGRLYCVGGLAGGTRDIAEIDTRTYRGRVLASLPASTYPDQDFSHLPEIDAFLIWTEEPKAYLVDRKTGAISGGPPNPLLRDGAGYRPQHNNRHPSGVIVIGWSASDKVHGRQLSEYWHYTLRSDSAWIPASGNAKAITEDASGAAVNLLASVAAPRGPHSGIVGVAAVTLAWGSGAYARDYSSYGALLLNNGGDGDYYGTEVYAFDFDARRWARLSDPSAAMSGDKTRDHLRDPMDPLYFNQEECEHGPAVAEYGAGPLPAGTTPGVPHNYDGTLWLPGSVVGNKRGAFVRPHSTAVYGARSTGRAHYFDLDTKTWGRFSANRAMLPSSRIPIHGYDEAEQRIWHDIGYLDLRMRRHVAKPWAGTLPNQSSACFDPVRRLFLGLVASATPDPTPGEMWAIAVDSSTTRAGLNLRAVSGRRWTRGNAFHAGLAYVPDLDCYYFYSQGSRLMGFQPQTIWKIQPPARDPLTEAWRVSEITMHGDTVVADTRGFATYKRIQWVAPLKCLAIYNGPIDTGFVYLYRPDGL